MGQVVNTLAFPVPELPPAFYAQDLERRRDLLYLTTTAGERIPACHVKCKPQTHTCGGADFLTVHTQPWRWTLLYSHGNAEDLGLQMDYIETLAEETQTNVFCYEYVGYSLSRIAGEQPSEEGCIRSIDAAWRYCTGVLKIPPEQIVLYGRSIGTGPSVDLASRQTVEKCDASPQNVGGVLLQSPLESGARVVAGPNTSFFGYILGLDIFTNYAKVLLSFMALKMRLCQWRTEETCTKA